MEVQYHQWIKLDTIKVKLEKGQKNTYAWEITYEGEDTKQVMDRISEMDAELRRKFEVKDES
ncbi:hypothetical protein LCGC14_2955160 [marine sediment metagenome]|uniref:Uncharacterized protein n=1 Tax=marine sediment metagenome TaxID=412755 RepID=A0A0F8Y165_9ZZZZ